MTPRNRPKGEIVFPTPEVNLKEVPLKNEAPSIQEAAQNQEVAQNEEHYLKLKDSLKELSIAELLRRGNMRAEKCEMIEAGLYFEIALDQAKKNQDQSGTCDALAHLLRHSSDRGAESQTERWVNELEIFLAQTQGKLTPYAWYCKGIVSYREGQYKKAQVLFNRFWRELENEENQNEKSDPALSARLMRGKAQALLALALVAHAQGKSRRAQYLGEVILKYAEVARPRGILASTYLFLCRLAERKNEPTLAKKWLQKAFAESVMEHNWYHYFYVLYGFARVSRLEQDFVQAKFYLELLEKATITDDFISFRREIAEERARLNLFRVDLEIDLNRGVLRTREREVNLRRQHLLIELMHELAVAPDHGLSKKEIIEKVWKEEYLPDQHDGKLYYNINRIRKLIEVDLRKPQYLMNWRQGYRLRPELKVRVISKDEGETQ